MSASAEAHERLTEASAKVVADLDRKFFRKMQADMHRCSAKCCDETTKPMEKVQNCIDRCQEPLLKAQADFQNQFKEAQDRLNRCIMQCNDQAKDQYQSNSSTHPDMSAYTRDFEDCASSCVDNFVTNGLPAMAKRIEDGLSKGRFF